MYPESNGFIQHEALMPAGDFSPFFQERNGPSWNRYLELLSTLDRLWRNRRWDNTIFGVFGPRPSWEDTILRGQALFNVESWRHLSDDQKSLIAPAHSFVGGDALLGSIGRRSNDVRAFLDSNDAGDDRDLILSVLKKAGRLSLSSLPILGGDMLHEMCRVQGMGRAFATRLLALARPDGFVVLNQKSTEWLEKASGLHLPGKAKSYNLLLRWLSHQEWYTSPEPRDDVEGRIWRMRAALLDAFAYQPEP